MSQDPKESFGPRKPAVPRFSRNTSERNEQDYRSNRRDKSSNSSRDDSGKEYCNSRRERSPERYREYSERNLGPWDSTPGRTPSSSQFHHVIEGLKVDMESELSRPIVDNSVQEISNLSLPQNRVHGDLMTTKALLFVVLLQIQLQIQVVHQNGN